MLRLLALAAWGLLLAGGPAHGGDAAAKPEPLPPFDEPRASAWINSEPLVAADLVDHVVLIEFWTFGCVNCTRSIPWVRQLEERYAGTDLVIVGVHTPEFDFEKKLDRLREFVADSGLEHPVLIDNDFRYWRRLDNRYWPAFYLVDRQGLIRHRAVGETHVDTPAALELERWIDELLAEPAGAEPRGR